MRWLLGAVLLPLSLHTHSQPELIFVPILKEKVKEYQLCINGYCHDYWCDYGPSFTEKSPGWWIVHTPCVQIDVACDGQNAEVCSHNGLTLREMPYGLEILEEAKLCTDTTTTGCGD